MIDKNYLLTFEYSKNNDELDIHCNEAGLSELLLILSQLKNKTDHTHLMTPCWGGNELTEETQSNKSQLINKVTIHKW